MSGLIGTHNIEQESHKPPPAKRDPPIRRITALTGEWGVLLQER